MDEKKRLVMETAIRLFAEKGYFSTSVQEIADQCGISKGSLYNYFQSKEDIFLSVVEFYHELIFNKAAEINNDSTISPKRRLVLQIKVLLDEYINNHQFIKMQFKEFPNTKDFKIKAFISRIRSKTISWYTKCLKEAYGKTISAYVWDLVIILQALTKEYLTHMIIEDKELPTEKTATFIVDRLDAMVNDLLIQRPEPLLTAKEFSANCNVIIENETPIDKALAVMNGLEEKINVALVSEERRKEMLATVDLLKEEVQQEKPRSIVIKVLLAYLAEFEEIEEIKGLVEN